MNLKYSESTDKHYWTFQNNFLVQFGKETDTGGEKYRMILSKNYGSEIVTEDSKNKIVNSNDFEIPLKNVEMTDPGKGLN